MFKGKVVAFALMLVIATSVYAGDVDDCKSTAGITGCAKMQLTVCPAGDFEFIRDACGTGITAYIWVTALDASSVPIPGIPWTDYWLNSCDPAKQLALCASPVGADSLTGANGTTTFSGRVAAGGCNAINTIPVSTQGIWWAIQGKPLKVAPGCTVNYCLNVVVKSPDVTGAGGPPDGVVNVSDLIPFGTSYLKNEGQAGYNPCCDYNDDAKCNLSDFAFFGTHYQHRC
jgi:hypothetical protein